MEEGKAFVCISLQKLSLYLHCLLQVLYYQMGKKCSLTSYHLVTKLAQKRDKESSLMERKVLCCRKGDCLPIYEASTISLKLLVAEAKLPFD